MLAVRAVLHGLFLASLVSLNHEDVKTDRDCDFVSCFDCVSVKCVWLVYFDGDENCARSSRGIPGVQDVIVTPRQCKKPSCMKPTDDNSGIIGLAQLLGGIFGGLFLGLCGGATCLKWSRHQFREFERLEGGRRTWGELATTFFRAILRQFAREVDVEGPLLADDEDGRGRRQQGGISHVNQQREVNERHRYFGGGNPQMVARVRVENQADNNQAAVVVPADVVNIVAHPPVAVEEDLGHAGVENLQGVVVPQIAHDFGQQVGGAFGHQEERQDHGDNGANQGGEEREVNEDQAVPPARVSPLVQQAQVIRQSVRKAALDAKERITNLKLNRLT